MPQLYKLKSITDSYSLSYTWSYMQLHIFLTESFTANGVQERQDAYEDDIETETSNDVIG